MAIKNSIKNTKSVLLFLMVFISSTSFAKCKGNDTNFVIDWVMQEYDSKGYFKFYLEGVNIDKDKYSDYIHVTKLGEINKGNEVVSLFMTGINSSLYYNDIIVYRYKPNKKECSVEYLWTNDEKHDLYSIYSFFEAHKEFDDKVKVICYQKVIINLHYIKMEDGILR